MGFEKRVLSITKDANVNGAYFAYGTMWVPCADNADCDVKQVIDSIQSELPGTRVITNVAGDEIAFDFASWDYVTV